MLRSGDFACAVLWRDGKLLLGLRGAHKRTYPNCWDILGGFVEAGETIEQALAREVMEEVGVAPTQWRKLTSITEPHPDLNGQGLYHVFLVTEWTGEVQMLGDEHTRLEWFEPEAAADLEDIAMPEYRDLFRLAASTVS